MEFRFNAEEWKRMTNAQRAHRCAVLAAEAQKLAEDAAPNFREMYLSIAQEWLALANAIANTPDCDGSSDSESRL